MAQPTQQITYHSTLHRHIHSILPHQDQQINHSRVYSSNKQPPIPSILSKSRSNKKSQQKSLKKGISRVTKSKGKIQFKQQNISQTLKGTLLNFNTQQVIESKYNLYKPKDQILQRTGERYDKSIIRQLNNGSPQHSVQNSRGIQSLQQYRITTYIPGPEIGQQKWSTSNQKNNQNKQNNLNQSNIRNAGKNLNHTKNQSQSIQIINSTGDNILQLNTWRTSQNFDQYYSNNYKTDINNYRTTQNNQHFNSLDKSQFNNTQPFNHRYGKGYSLIEDKNQQQPHERYNNFIGNDQEKEKLIKQNKEMKEKIKHLEHEIVICENDKAILKEENADIKRQNQELLVQIQKYVNNQSSKVEKLPEFVPVKNHQLQEYAKKNKQLTQKVSQYFKQVKRYQQKLQSQQQKLYKSDSKLNQLTQLIQKLKLQNSKLKQKSFRSEPNKKSFNYLDGSYEQKLVQNNTKRLQDDLINQKIKYQKLQRQFLHLQQKNTFMKDELEHIKYLQNNASSSALSHRSNYKSLQKDIPSHNKTTNNYNDTLIIQQLQIKLSSLQKTHHQTQQQYSNLKQNFRALQQLYIKQQDQITQLQQLHDKTKKQNSKLKIQLTNLQQINNAKRVSLRQEHQNSSMKIMEKEEAFARLDRQYATLQRRYEELNNDLKRTNIQKQQLNQKYLIQIQKSTLLSKRHKQDIDLCIMSALNEQKIKYNKLCQQLQNCIDKLRIEITFKEEEIIRTKAMHIDEIKRLQNQFEISIHKIMSEQTLNLREQNVNRTRKNELAHGSMQKENSMRYSRSTGKYNPSYLNKSRKSTTNAQVFDITINYQSMSRKQLQNLASSLQQQFHILQNRHKTLLIECQALNDSVQQNNRLLAHLQTQIGYYKEQKQNSNKQKLELRQQVQKINSMMMEFKKTNTTLQEQNKYYKSQLKQIEEKHSLFNKENGQLSSQVKTMKEMLFGKEKLLDHCEKQLKQLRVVVAQSKQFNEKLIRENTLVKEERETHKSKEQYYKMLFQKSQKQLQFQLSQKATQLSTIKLQSSPLKRSRSSSKPSYGRQTQLYRLQIYKDFNKLLNLSSQIYTLQQIVSNNEQQYLLKLYETVKEQIKKADEMKALIVGMEEGFRNQKIHIKNDYDQVYEKYLKYKAMSQSMEKDIDKYKSLLRKKDDKFMGIII